MRTRLGSLIALLATAGVVSAQQGSYVTFGTGCPGSRGVPILTATGDHKVGGVTSVQVARLRERQPAVFFIGGSNKIWLGKIPLPFDLGAIGMKGCRQYVSTEVAVPMSTGPGFTTAIFRFPLQRELVGFAMFHQLIALDPGASTRLVVSNAGKVTVGVACKDGDAGRAQGKFDIKLPPIDALATPELRVVGSFDGTCQMRCCGGVLESRKACTYKGGGQAVGTAPAFTVGVPGEVAKAISDAACAEVKRVTNVVGCTASFNKLRVEGMRLTGAINATMDDCRSTYGYTGGGKLTFGKVSAVARVTFKIKILFTFNYTTDIDLTANPVGTWKIENNRLSASASVPSVKASKSFTIPIINKKISFSYTANTKELSGTTDEVELPKPPIECHQ